MTTSEPEIRKYHSFTTSDAIWDRGTWEVNLKIVITRTNKNGVESVCNFSVKSYDKDLNRAQATTQLSAAAYFNTHTEEELYGTEKSQASDIENTKS